MIQKGRRKGFSIVEVLIAIAVLSIGILGTISAIAFGVRATDLGSRTTQSMGYTRRVLELILQGGAKGPTSGASLNTGVYNNSWVVFCTPGGTMPYNFGTGDFTNSADTNDTARFIEEAQRYEVKVHLSTPATGNSAIDSNMVLVEVGMRWFEKTARRETSVYGYFRRT